MKQLIMSAIILLSADVARAQAQLDNWYLGELKVEMEYLKSVSNERRAGKICAKKTGVECFKEAYAKSPARSANALGIWLTHSILLCQDKNSTAKKVDLERAFPCAAWLWKNVDTSKFHVLSQPDFGTPEGKEELLKAERKLLPKAREQAEKVLQKSIDATKSPTERADRKILFRELKSIDWRL